MATYVYEFYMASRMLDEHSSKITTNVDAPIASVSAFEAMIVECRVWLILREYSQLYFELLSLSGI